MPISQNGEAEIVANYFGSYVGTLIDIGAGGGVALSNSFELGQLGWGGLLVEASPIHFQNLVSNYIHHGKFQFLNAAVWEERKLMKFHLNSYFYSSLIEKDEPGLYHAHYYVPTVTAADLAEIQPQVDFISLDIEGADSIVFPHLARQFPECRLFCVEHGNRESVKLLWAAIFDSFDLKVVAETCENFLVSHK